VGEKGVEHDYAHNRGGGNRYLKLQETRKEKKGNCTGSSASFRYAHEVEREFRLSEDVENVLGRASLINKKGKGKGKDTSDMVGAADRVQPDLILSRWTSLCQRDRS